MNQTFKSILKTFFSNDACIETSCMKKIVTNIVAIIFALISIILIPLPTVISINKNKGSNWIKKQNYTYGFEDGIMDFFEGLKQEEININFKNKNELVVEKKGVFLKEYSWFWKKKQNPNDKIHNKYLYLAIYFTEKTGKDYQTFCENKKNEDKTTIMIFGKKQLNCYFFNQKNKNYEGNLSNNYKNIKEKSLSELFVEKNKKETMKKWEIFFDDIYENEKGEMTINEIVYEILIIIPIIFFSGSIIWFLSHTKNNLYRIHNFWTSQKIMFYISLTPSILSFLFGIMIKSIFLFIILIIIRIRSLSKIFRQNDDYIT